MGRSFRKEERFCSSVLGCIRNFALAGPQIEIVCPGHRDKIVLRFYTGVENLFLQDAVQKPAAFESN